MWHSPTTLLAPCRLLDSIVAGAAPYRRDDGRRRRCTFRSVRRSAADIDADGAVRVAADIGGVAVVLDVTDPVACDATLASVGGWLDIDVNNSARSQPSGVERSPGVRGHTERHRQRVLSFVSYVTGQNLAVNGGRTIF